MKKLLVALVAALLVLATGMSAFADDKAPAAAEPAKESVAKEEKAAAPAESAKEAAPAASEQGKDQPQQAPAAEKK